MLRLPDSPEGLLYIGNDIVYMFDADGQPYQIGRQAASGAGRWIGAEPRGRGVPI